ncbi:DUF6770 family protein [Mucilaginibacter sp. OK098]|uniref:DUF6770 family protein n=1 Tax=Mucilaginibacter sp. OK098 TaxID=1855297 RepID=UPI000913A532|nr:DUF6770 family protein [Mucilaginibacter sp. OK098]SHN28774.1 hypothetical protein SAMN05216524_108196 [Mucilaginibacter sp. OK098]
MKFKLLIIFFALLSLKGFTQNATKAFNEVKNVTVRNIGAITKNNVVKGYFSFYEFDKADKKNVIYKLNLLDENLNDLGTKEITGPKDWELVGSGYDGNNFCFKFYDDKNRTFELKVYDQEAKEVASNILKINYKPNSNSKYHIYRQMVNPDINIVNNNGFVDYTFNDPNDAFIVSYANGNSQKTWQQTYQPEGKSKFMIPTFLNGNDEMILTAVARVEKGMYNAKTQHTILANNTKTGDQLFDVSTEFDDNHVVPINAIFEDGKVIVIGLNYKTTKTFTKAPDGMAFLEFDKTGKLLKSNFKTFEETLGKYLPIEDHKLKDGYYLYIHDVVRTNRNSNLVIAEKFKKAVDAGGIAMSLLGSSESGPVKLQLENMLVLEYDLDGNILQAKEIPKAKGTTPLFPSYLGLLSPYLLGTVANALGWMDYMYTLKSEDNANITFSFVDYDRLDADAKKTKNFGQIKYNNGKLTIDKIPVKNEKATFSRLLRAKTNHVLQVNYFKKDKKLTMDMIKLNN